MSVNIYNSNPNATSEEENFSCVADRGSKLASDTIYSNTTSGLNSVDVQGAIDEVNEKVEDNVEAISQINSDLTDKSFSVTASNSSINLTSFDCKRFGSMAKISMFGTTVRQLEANKAYFIPNLYINEMQNVNLYGCGITRTSSSLNDGADSFPCVVSISGHNVCFTPLVTMPSNFGMVIELLCYLVP